MRSFRDTGRRLAVLAATGFGLGYSPVASGTAGTLLGVAGVAWLWPHLDVAAQAVFALACVAAALPVCGIAERHFGTKDDGRIVADEYLTFPLCMLALPAVPTVLLFAFLTHRIFDILKPPPARGIQRWHGGPGIVADDVLAAAYSLVLNHLFFRYAWPLW